MSINDSNDKAPDKDYSEDDIFGPIFEEFFTPKIHVSKPAKVTKNSGRGIKVKHDDKLSLENTEVSTPEYLKPLK